MIKLKKDKEEEILNSILEDIRIADAHYESVIEPKVIVRRQAYQSDSEYYKRKFPRLSGISDLTSSDVADTIEWAMPSLLRIFFAGEDVVSLQGVNVEDDKPAEVMQQLIQYQLTRHNRAFTVFHDWFKSALIENVGILKCYWDRQLKRGDTYEIYLDPSQYKAFKATPNIKITKEEPQPDNTIKITYDEFSMVKNQPIIECTPVSELRYSPDARDINNCDFVAHRKLVDADYLRRKQKAGIYTNVEAAIENAGNVQYTQYELVNNPNLNTLNKNEGDTPRKKMHLYECYTKLDIDDDKLLENVIITVVNQKIIRVDENTMGRHPFFLISPIRDPMKIWAEKGICDLVSQLQDLKTILIRQIIDNVALNNDKQAFVNVDMLVDVHEFIQGKKAVRVQGDPKQAVYYMPVEQLQAQVFQFLEYIEQMKENRTGITRYNQGSDANSLNKTASGINQIMQASNQRLELISRMFMENGVDPLYRHLIRLNQEFITNDVVIRITNESKTITPDDLQGEIDIIVNSGLGTGSKEHVLQNIQLLLNLYPQMIQFGIATPAHAAYAMGKLVVELGWKNKDDFLYSPEQVNQMQGQNMQQMQQQMQEMQKQLQKAQAGQKGPSESINYKDVSATAKAQMLAQVGIQVNPQEIQMWDEMQNQKSVQNQQQNQDHQANMQDIQQKHDLMMKIMEMNHSKNMQDQSDNLSQQKTVLDHMAKIKAGEQKNRQAGRSKSDTKSSPGK